jgi:hypothetical protein
LQTRPQVPLSQVALPFGSLGQTVLQSLQWFGSLVVSTQSLPHMVGVTPLQVAAQL